MSLQQIIDSVAQNATPANTVEFMVYGRYAMFTNQVFKLSGEQFSESIPSHEALRGILMSIYYKPTLKWYIDAVRIMNPIKTECKGILLPQYNGGKDLSYYTYLKDVCYQVRAHFEWNLNQPDLERDRNKKKHHEIALRAISKGGYRDVFLGKRECQAYVEPCAFGSGKGYYDDVRAIEFGLTRHGFTYPEEAYSPETEGMLTENFWEPVMRHGVILFPRPENCPVHKTLKPMEPKRFGEKQKNISLISDVEVLE